MASGRPERWGIRARRRAAHVAIYGTLVAATAVMMFPVAWMLTVSIRPNVEVMKIPPQWIPTVFTLAPYARVLGSARYLRTFANSYFVALVVTAFSLFVGALAAYALARFRFRGQRSVIMFLIITQMFPLVLLCIPYFRIVVRLGLYDTLTALVLVYATFTLPFCILMLRSYFAQIPREMEEAAMVDGCSRLGAIVRTLLPLSFPALVGAGLYTFLLAWNEFLFAVVLIESWEKRVITVAIYSLLAEFVTEWSMMMAFSVLASAPLVVAFIFLQRFVVQGMTAGAIKS
ncbi:MAG TPA: carbohydrate ABC transporter permease [Candidatus Methylomirabilis sp.]|nr:carbohydrate ABC transporter permease [Candidatus Methylomirabilis sp.]